MRKRLLILLFAFPLCVLRSAPSQAMDKEVVKAIMINQWVTKYKKLKTDLENKAAFLKSMEKISESDLEQIRQSYTETSLMLDTWLDHLIQSIHQNRTTSMENLANGDIPAELKAELQDIFTFYANDFSTLYEDITGKKSGVISTNNTEEEDENPRPAVSLDSKEASVEMTELISKVKEPLKTKDWSSLY